MNLKPLSVWAFILSLFSYLMCIINTIVVLVLIMPIVGRMGNYNMTNPLALRSEMMGQLGSGYVIITTVLTWTAILIAAVALILSIMAFSKAKGEKYPGKGFAVTGLVLAAVYLGLALLGLLIGLLMGNSMGSGVFHV